MSKKISNVNIIINTYKNVDAKIIIKKICKKYGYNNISVNKWINRTYDIMAVLIYIVVDNKSILNSFTLLYRRDCDCVPSHDNVNSYILECVLITVSEKIKIDKDKRKNYALLPFIENNKYCITCINPGTEMSDIIKSYGFKVISVQ